MKKMIGVMPLWDEKKDSIWMFPGYLGGLEAAGGLPFIFPLTTDEESLIHLTDLCSGILLTGGHDVNPARYGEAPLDASVSWTDTRDEMEYIVIRRALETNKRILGICRGLQLLNVYLGGNLYQDLPTQHPSAVNHLMTSPYDRPQHTVNIHPDTPLHALLGRDTLGVNSVHHQAVRTLAPSLREMAAADDGITEAAYLPDREFVWAIQWHPEFWYPTDEASRKIFAAFVN